MATVGLKPPSHDMQMRRSLLSDDSLDGRASRSSSGAREEINADAYLNFGFGGDFLDQSSSTDLGLNAAALANREYISLEEFDLDGDGEVEMDQLEELMAKLNKYKKKEQKWRRFLLVGIVGIVFFALILLGIVVLGYALTRETAVTQTQALTDRSGKVIATESFYEPLNAQRRNTLQQTDKIVGWFGDQYVNAEISTVIQKTVDVYEFRTYRDNFYFRLDVSSPLNVMQMYLQHKDGNISSWAGRLSSNQLSTQDGFLTPAANSTTTTPAPTIQRRRLGAGTNTAATIQSGHRSIPQAFVDLQQENMKRSCYRYQRKVQVWRRRYDYRRPLGVTRTVRCPMSIGFDLRINRGGPGSGSRSILQLRPRTSRYVYNYGSTPHIYTDSYRGVCVRIVVSNGLTLYKCDYWQWIDKSTFGDNWFIRVDVGCSWTKLWANGREALVIWHERNIYYRYIRSLRYLRFYYLSRYRRYWNWRNYVYWCLRERLLYHRRRRRYPRIVYKKSSKKKKSRSSSSSSSSSRRLLNNDVQDNAFSVEPSPQGENEHLSDEEHRRKMLRVVIASRRNYPRYSGYSMNLYAPGYERSIRYGSYVELNNIYVVCDHSYSKYHFVNKRMDFFSANLYCNKHYGTSLISIASPDENAKAYSEIYKNRAQSSTTWIGLYRIPRGWRYSRAFVWMDGSSRVYSAWNHYRRYWRWYTTHDCTGLRTVRYRYRWGRWYTYRHWYTSRCSDRNRFLCWKRGWLPTCYTYVPLSVDYRRWDLTIPNCPTLFRGYYTFEDAKKRCITEDLCSAIGISAWYSYSSNQKRRSWVDFYKWDQRRCNQRRRISWSQLHRAYAYFNRSCDGVGTAPPPTPRPTASPTRFPTRFPSKPPTKNPTKNPTKPPTKNPTKPPSTNPSRSPTRLPTKSPSAGPSRSPSVSPTKLPSSSPTMSPSKSPSKSPSAAPTKSPTTTPTRSPSRSPSMSPTITPTRSPLASPCSNTNTIVFVEKRENWFSAQSYCQRVYNGQLAKITSYDQARALMEMALSMKGLTSSTIQPSDPITPWTAGFTQGGNTRWEGYGSAAIQSTWPATGNSIYVGGTPGDLTARRCLQFANPTDPYAFSLLEFVDCVPSMGNYFFCENNKFEVFIETKMTFDQATTFCKTTYCGGIACPSVAIPEAEIAYQYQGPVSAPEPLAAVYTGAYYDGISNFKCDEWALASTPTPRVIDVTNQQDFTREMATLVPNDPNTIACMLPGQYGNLTYGYTGTAADRQKWWKCDRTVQRRFWCTLRGHTQDPTQSPTTSSPSRAPTKSPTSSPTKSPSNNPSVTPTKSPSNNPSSSPTKNPSVSPTNQPSNSPSTSPTKQPSASPSTSPSASPSKSPSKSPTVGPTLSPSKSPSRSPTRPPSVSPTKNPSFSPTLSPTKNPSVSPTKNPSVSPSKGPSSVPSNTPSSIPTNSPSSVPSSAPSAVPTQAPSLVPTQGPSQSPSRVPTTTPSLAPSLVPTSGPTVAPSLAPSLVPTAAPTFPTSAPTFVPTFSPSASPSSVPSAVPSVLPSAAPTPAPTTIPTDHPTPPTGFPTNAPTKGPTNNPSLTPTNGPSATPTTSSPSVTPSTSPSKTPSGSPTNSPSASPTKSPSNNPSTTPSNNPSATPTKSPSNQPSGSPTKQPSGSPTLSPTNLPSRTPTKAPSQDPSASPTRFPSTTPTKSPSVGPSRSPSKSPTQPPSLSPSKSPTKSPSRAPTEVPSVAPTTSPTTQPPSQTPTTASPSGAPTPPTTLSPSRTPTTSSPSSTPTVTPTSAPNVPINKVQIVLPLGELNNLAFEFELPGGSLQGTPATEDCFYNAPQTATQPFIYQTLTCGTAATQCRVGTVFGTPQMECSGISPEFVQNADGSCPNQQTTTTFDPFGGQELNQNSQTLASRAGTLWELSVETFVIYGCVFLFVGLLTLYQLGKIYVQNAIKTSMLVSATHVYVMILSMAWSGTMFYFATKAYILVEDRLSITFAGLTTWAVVSTAGAIALNWLQLYFWNLKGLSNWKAKLAARPYRSAINYIVIGNCIIPMGLVFGAILDARTTQLFQVTILKTSYWLLAIESLIIFVVFMILGVILAIQVHTRSQENRELYGEDYESPLDKLVFRLAVITFSLALVCLYLGIIAALFAAQPESQMLLLVTRSSLVVAAFLALMMWIYLYVPAVKMTIEQAERKRRARQTVDLASKEESSFGSSRGSVTMELDGSRGRFGSRRDHDEFAQEAFANARLAANERAVEEQKAKKNKKKRKRKKKQKEYSSALDEDIAPAEAAPVQADEGGFEPYDDYQPPPHKDSTFQNLPDLPASYGERI